MELRKYSSRVTPTSPQWQGNLGVNDYRKKQTKRQSQFDPAFSLLKYILIYFLKNFFLPYPASPSNPEPRRSMVVGSGTGAEVSNTLTYAEP